MSARWAARIRVALGSFELDVDLEGGPRPTVVVGPNGSGKTTLLRALAGGVAARGTIRVAGRLWLDYDGGVSLDPEARRCGYVPQGSGLFPHLSVLENVCFGLRGRPGRLNEAMRMLESMEATELTERAASTLSGGQAQRVALARALVTRPDMLLLDEPLSAVDLGGRGPLRSLIREQAELRPTVIVTHDPKDIRALDPEIVVLERGRVVQRGRPDELAAAPAGPLVGELFDGWGASR